MSRWLVSNLPSWLLLLGLIVVVAGGPVLMQFVVRQRFPRLRRTSTTIQCSWRLSTAYTQVLPRTDAQTRILATSFTNLDKMSQARTERLLQARTDVGPPWSLWAVIFLTSGLLLGGAIVYGVDQPVVHYTMAAIVGMLVAAELFLVLQLSRQTRGDVVCMDSC